MKKCEQRKFIQNKFIISIILLPIFQPILKSFWEEFISLSAH